MSVCLWAGVFLYVHACVCVCCWNVDPRGKRVKDFPDIKEQVADREKRGQDVQLDDNTPRWTPGLYGKAATWRKPHTHTHTRAFAAHHFLTLFPLQLCSKHTHTNPLKGLQSLSLVVMHVSVILRRSSQPPCTSHTHPRPNYANPTSDLYTHRCEGHCPWTCVSSPVLWRALRPHPNHLLSQVQKSFRWACRRIAAEAIRISKVKTPIRSLCVSRGLLKYFKY